MHSHSQKELVTVVTYEKKTGNTGENLVEIGEVGSTGTTLSVLGGVGSLGNRLLINCSSKDHRWTTDPRRLSPGVTYRLLIGR